MSKKLTIETIAERSGVPKKTVETVLTHLAHLTETELRIGNEVVLPGVGKFKAMATKPRTGRNPATGESVEIPAGKKVKFTAASTFKKAVAA